MNWYLDLNMVLFDMNDFVIFWILLRLFEEDDVALYFANRSYWDFLFSYWRILEGMEDFEGWYEIDMYDEFDLGDFIVYYGWCFYWSLL